MDDSERAPQSRVIAASAQIQMLKHEKRVLARLSLTQGGGNPGTGCGERRETVGLGCETVKLRAVVDFREIFSTVALEYEAAVDATSRDRRRALDAKRPGGIGNGRLQRGEEFRGCDHATRRPLRDRARRI